jgi:MSHA pilin protein MshD
MFTRSRGVTLVELIVFMVIVAVALAGLFGAFSTMTRGSADPQVRKQVLAIAESLMEEVQLMPFTYCDPDDPNAATTTTGTAGCTGGANGPNDESRLVSGNLGPETAGSLGGAEGRYASPQFDNVSDYHGFAMGPGILNLAMVAVSGLEAYSASIGVTQAGLAGIAADQALKISVTVTGPGGVSVTLDGYRTRYAPNTTP